MKYKTNIPALIVAFVVLFTTSGVFVFEHICNTSKTRSFSMVTKPACDMEKTAASCCNKKPAPKKKDCCEHKEFFSKLNAEGFLSKLMVIKPVEKIQDNFFCYTHSAFTPNAYNFYYSSGLSPPEYYLQIKSLLLPERSELQVFRC
ncbi:MAG: hypothetical protein U0T77_03570 [Chitinophagales bacterium]